VQCGTFFNTRNSKQVNTPSTFSVLLRDDNNQPLTGVSDQPYAKIQCHNMTWLTTSVEKVEMFAIYEMSYTPTIRGDHTVSVHVGGVPILGSPFQ